MIFKKFAILFSIIAIALPIIAPFLVYLSTEKHDVSMGGAYAFAFAYALIGAPSVFFIGCILGAVLQGIYNFSVAKSLFAKIKNFTIYQNKKGNYLVFFKEKIKKQWLVHCLKINFLSDTYCHFTHSTVNANQESKELCSKNVTIHEAAQYNYSIRASSSLRHLFAFLSRCLSLELKNNETILLHHAKDDYEKILPIVKDYCNYEQTLSIPQAIKDLQIQENKIITKRFLGLMAVIASPFVAIWLYVNSTFILAAHIMQSLIETHKKLNNS